MATDAPVQIPRQRISELIEREEKQLNERTQRSNETYKRAQVHLSGGVASSYQLRDPWPIYLERGSGPSVWDVDGNQMWDFHNGFGSMVQGHAHPGDRRGDHRPLRVRHALRGADRGRDRRRRRARAPLGPAEVALHQLRLGVHDGRDPDRPRHHRARDDREDLRLLPRPPRRRDGLDRRRVRPDRRPREPRLACPTARASRRPSSTSRSRSRSTTRARWSGGSSG